MELFAGLADDVYSVSQLTREIKDRLEGSFPSLRVEGEISNFRAPTSGHFYFTLKDDASQIRVVMFRSRNQALPFLPEDGMQVTMRASLTVYQPRGEYQLIAEWMEPQGQGNLQRAFEALKQKLAAEGLFDPDRKKPLPFLPSRIGLITSPTGAAVRDMIKVLWRRYPNVSLRFCPVRVQGDLAGEEIADALEMLNEEGRAEVIILGRGGGSLEDLWAFNEEGVARAVAASRIPVVSAVGHETDFTISDFVADLRAPTPSAAAELVVPEKSALVQRTAVLEDRLKGAARNVLGRKEDHLHHLTRRLRHPGRRVQESLLRLDELSDRLFSAQARHLRELRSRIEVSRAMLRRASPARRVEEGTVRMDTARRDLFRFMQHAVHRKQQLWKEVVGRLDSLSPMAVLSRGYSITKVLPTGAILRDAGSVTPGDAVEIILASGELACTVDTVRSGEGKEP